MELNLRTTLLQQIAGQSRRVVDTAIQTTKFTVGFFLQHGHKSLEDIFDETEEEQVPISGSDPSSKDSIRDVEDYHILKKYICGKIAMTQPIHEDLIDSQAQALIEVLKMASLTVQEMHGIFLSMGKNEVKFYAEMRRRLEQSYKERGPPQMWFANFVGFVSEFLDGRAVPVSAGAEGGTPAWYVCRNCRETGQHLWDDCPRFKHDSEDDCEYLKTLNLLRRKHRYKDDVLLSLQALRKYVESVLKISTKHMSSEVADLCTGIAENCVVVLATKDIAHKNLTRCRQYDTEKIEKVDMQKHSPKCSRYHEP